MILKNSTYFELAENVIQNRKKIIVYGAGMIGKVIVPYLIAEYNLYDYLLCFIDGDIRKKGRTVYVGGREYGITTPDYLEKADDECILLITNSRFFPIINFLDSIPELDNIDGYIIPMMQIYELENARSIIIERKKDKPAIPKKIHYCWFGRKELPNFLKKCICSWREMCPDYEVIEWNEDNYDVNRHSFTQEAYESQRYGFVSDVARLDILYENGGIYMDTDVMLNKNLDELLYQDGFVGTEKWGNVNTGGGCGFTAGHPMLKELLQYREQFHFVLDDGSLNTETNGVYETIPFMRRGFNPNNMLQTVGGVTIYPSYVNHPYDYMSCELHYREATVSVHYFYGGWMEEDEKLNRKKTQEKYKEIIYRIKNGGMPL